MGTPVPKDDLPANVVPADDLPDGMATPRKPSAANAGLVNFGTSVLGTPVDAVENVLNLGRAAYNVATRQGAESTPPMRGSVGTSEWLREKLRNSGIPILSPDNPNPQDKIATSAYEFASRGGAVPGGAIPAVGSMIAEKIGGPQWAGVGALAPSASISAYNASRATTLAKQEAQNQVRDASAEKGMDAGYVLPPSRLNPNPLNKTVEGIAGKESLRYEAEHANQQVTNNLARKAIGLPENSPITEQTLRARRDVLAEPYRQVSAISPMASQLLQKLRDLRAEATAEWKYYDMQGVPDAQRKAKVLDQRADMVETALEKVAARTGKPELMTELKAARVELAKTYDVERALNIGNGNIDARIIGKALDRGRPFTGELETIAKFSEAFPQFTREASKVPTPQLGRLDHAASGALALGGYSTLGPYGVAAAAIPYMAGPARKFALSDIAQRNMARPSYSPAMQPQGNLEALIQQAIINQQQ